MQKGLSLGFPVKKNVQSTEKKAVKPRAAKNAPGAKPALVQERGLLHNALLDLEGELKNLQASRAKVERKVNSISRELGGTQRKEIELQNQINGLKQKENELIKKKGSIKDKIEGLDHKIEKVKAIERELKDV